MTAEELLSHKERWREEHAAMSLTDMVKRFRLLQESKEALTAELAMVNVEFDLLRFEAIPEKMDGDGITNIKLEGLGKITLEGELFVELPAADRPAFYAWLDERGYGDIVQQAIAPTTLKAFVKARMRAGDELPALLKVRPASKAKLTRG